MSDVVDVKDDEEAERSEQPRAVRSRTVAVVLTAALGAVLAFLLVKDSLTDDAFITLAYAKNVATDLHWGLIPQGVSNSATSPLNVLLLAAVTTVLRVFGGVYPILALGVVTVGLTMLMAWGWARIVRALRLPMLAAVLGIALVLVNPFVLSAVGLEVVLIPTVLVLLVAMALEGRPVWFGAVSALAVLTRLDLVVFVLVIALGTAAIRRRALVALLSAVVVAAPWYVFSWFALGSAIPDTLLIKTMQPGLFGEWSFLTGPVMYFMGRHLVVTLAFLPMVLGVFALVSWLAVRWSAQWGRPSALRELAPVVALGVGGVLHYAVYSLMGVGPYHWYFVTPMVSLSTFLAAMAGVWWSRSRQVNQVRPGPPAVLLGLIGLLVAGNLAVDLKQGVSWKSPVIFGNWASAQDYARVGIELGERLRGATVRSPGEIGTLAYYCDCAIVDEFSDRGLVLEKVNLRMDTADSVTGLLLRLNYAKLDRTTPPRAVDYQLEYALGPGSGPDTWTVYSAAKGVGHFTLVPVRGNTQTPGNSVG